MLLCPRAVALPRGSCSVTVDLQQGPCEIQAVASHRRREQRDGGEGERAPFNPEPSSRWLPRPAREDRVLLEGDGEGEEEEEMTR